MAETVTTDPNSAADGLDLRRRRLRFRCWHRGILEVDLLLGRFADARLAGLSNEDVSALERLMEAPDQALFGWITGGEPPPAAFDLPILQDIRDFHRDNPTAEAASTP